MATSDGMVICGACLDDGMWIRELLGGKPCQRCSGSGVLSPEQIAELESDDKSSNSVR